MDCAVGPVHHSPPTTQISSPTFSSETGIWEIVQLLLVSGSQIQDGDIQEEASIAFGSRQLQVSYSVRTSAQPPTACTVYAARKGKAGNRVDPR